VKIMKRIHGMHAVLTGGSRGLGPTIARALLREGARVTLTARTADALEAVAKNLAAGSARVHTVAADVGDGDDRRKLLEEAEAALGPVDILINNAGIELMAPYASLPPERIQAIVRTNLDAPLMLSRLVLPRMIERGRGHVIMMSSLGGKKGSPYSATYAATKAGLIAWTGAVRSELRGTGVGVSVVSPGFVSEVGMFAVRSQRAPWLLGTSTPEAVADAVVRAVAKDVGEIIVNRGPVRFMLALDALSPRLSTWVLRTSGVYDYYLEQAESEAAAYSPEQQ
jgi:short-subunit dehydrogenase